MPKTYGVYCYTFGEVDVFIAREKGYFIKKDISSGEDFVCEITLKLVSRSTPSDRGITYLLRFEEPVK